LTVYGAQRAFFSGQPYLRTVQLGRGDVDQDGTITVVDALFVGQKVDGGQLDTPMCLSCGDVNCDGILDNADALAIASFHAGILTALTDVAACLEKGARD
jgi:hypothetical protein